MSDNFLKMTVTESVSRAQEEYYGRSEHFEGPAERDALTDEEITFIQARDSFYMASVSESSWPYVQHRGGSPGFLRVLNSSTLAFADYKGNRQLLSTGNLAANNRVALFLMDYPERTRLKILGHARVEAARERPELVAQLAEPNIQRIVERLFFIDVVSFDWNCQKYIVPRYTDQEVQQMIEPLKQRIAELEGRTSGEGVIPSSDGKT